MCVFRPVLSIPLLIVVGSANIAGCKHSDNLVPLEGTVTLNSKPLANATVLLSPTRGNGPGPFVGITNSEGRFALGPVGKEGTGAAVDSFMVMITTVKPDPNFVEGSSPPSTQKEVVPLKYRDGSQRFSVPEGGTKDAVFDIKGQ